MRGEKSPLEQKDFSDSPHNLCGQEEGTSKNWRGFIDKTEARLAPGIDQNNGLY